jgi:predicted dehydrogenase
MNSISRRNFLRSASAVTAGAVIIPSFISCAPSRKINVAAIAAGGKASGNINAVAKDPNVNIVALCDVDENRASGIFKKYPNAKRYKDFRKMFDEMANDIDAVLVSTPDHVHFAATMAAMQLGKHVYVEKPLAHNVWQLRTLQKAAHYYNVITQMGNQGHATDGIRRVKEWYDAGITGDVTEIVAWFGGPKFGEGKYFTKPSAWPVPEETIPEHLDWDLWLGPQSPRPYNPVYVPKSWRGFYDFGNAELGDWACHTLDAPFWALDLGMPTATECIQATGGSTSFVPDSSIIKFEFPARGKKPPVTLTWYEGGLKPENRPEWKMDKISGSGMIMMGEKQNIMTGGRPDNARLMMPKEEWEAWVKNEMPEASIRRIEGGPQQEFIDAIKGGPAPGSNFDYATRLTEMSLIGVMAQRFNTRIEYDAINMKVTNHNDKGAYIKEPVRKGWEYGEEVWK